MKFVLTLVIYAFVLFHVYEVHSVFIYVCHLLGRHSTATAHTASLIQPSIYTSGKKRLRATFLKLLFRRFQAVYQNCSTILTKHSIPLQRVLACCLAREAIFVYPEIPHLSLPHPAFNPPSSRSLFPCFALPPATLFSCFAPIFSFSKLAAS